MAYPVLEERIERRSRELETLLEVSNDVASTLELDVLLDKLFAQLGKIVAYDGVSVSLIEGDNTLVLLDYRIPAARGPLNRRWQANDDAVAVLGHLLEIRAPIIIPDVLADTPDGAVWRASALRTGRGHAGIRTWMGVPLLAGKRQIGMLTLEHREANYYTSHDAELAMALGNQLAVAIENARLYAQAQELAALQERQKLARELHDSVSQALYGIGLGTKTALQLIQTESVEKKSLEPALEYILSLATSGLAEMRALIFELRPESLEIEGLLPALTRRVDILRARGELDVVVTLGEEPDLPLAAKEVLYRVAQEALHNVSKHAHASQVALTLIGDKGEVTLEVADNGTGFELREHYPGHLGLRSMRERVGALGGSFSVQSAPGMGTAIRVSLPRTSSGSAQAA
ncbi:MAG: GAF domain-containing sensor histidine kinase [Anaerolineae bacterium]|nr:GAF domain-containing sensor histidine kinase [Anaerolineae bacterium]